MVFAREVNGQVLTFGVSGKLIMNAVVLYDHQTDTLWSQFLQTAVQGPQTGTKLKLVPVQLTTWEAWRDQHPDTLVLDKGVDSQGSLYEGFDPTSFDPYLSYYAGSNAGILGETNTDDRLDVKALVLGIDVGRVQKAYSMQDLSLQPVVNDTYDGRAIVVTFDPIVGTTAVFDRSFDDGMVTFELADQRGDGVVLLRDEQTGSIWNGATGVALSGPLEGRQMEQLASFVSFWFAWTDFYPDTLLYVPGEAAN